MPRYSALRDPRDAASEFRGKAGNYVTWDRYGRPYAGRQGPGGDRIGAQLRERPGQVVAVQFMRDGYDDPCLRAERERATVATLQELGYSPRNKITPSTPKACKRRH